MSEQIAVISITLSGGSAWTLDEAASKIEALAREMATRRGLTIGVTQDQEIIHKTKAY